MNHASGVRTYVKAILMGKKIHGPNMNFSAAIQKRSAY